MPLPFDVHRLLPAFISAAQLRSFSKAARQLGVTPAAVSKNIRTLEEKLSLCLFLRNTHNVTLTAEGKNLLAQVAPLWQALSATLEQASSHLQPPAGVVRMSIIPGFARQLLAPLLPSFLANYPDIKLDLSLEARVVNLIAEGYDVALGNRIDPDSRLIARPLGQMQMVIVASPAYLSKYGIPDSPDALLQHNCLLHRNLANGRRMLWKLQWQNALTIPDLRGNLISSDPEMLLDAALADLGIICIARWYVETYLSAGSLMPVLKHCWLPAKGLWLYYANASLPPRVRVWVDFLLKHFSSV